MSIKIMNEVWEHAPVDGGSLLVLLALADSADEKTRTCYPGISSIASKARLSERQAQYCLKRLREEGIIRVDRNASPIKTNLYVVSEISTWPASRDANIAPPHKSADTQFLHLRDATHCVSDTQSIAPKPSVTSVIEPSVTREGADLFSAQSQQESPGATLDHGFEEFWKRFPDGRKTDKRKTRELFDRIVTGKHKSIPKTPAETIIAAAKRYRASGPDPQYAPMPTTWLNGERWDQWPEPERKTPARIEDQMPHVQVFR